ncbi:hypothetical protein HHK36_015474 [Tetracentron sinense]|uniref:Uncharacterized protein n=1 Tax=Tetracentron sinense TaxID=13715 RepID=A0A834Z346_TETSI|nr:hypothetical protein HHK36_015474 [Tetracentron sinense]
MDYCPEMAMQTSNPAPAISAQVVGNTFVEQYYHILHQSPELVYRFYQDSSLLSRPESNGVMTSVTTMRAINEKILSLDYKDYKAEIKTADAQESFEKGVIVLVTGFLTGKDNVRRKFTQLFFLAPQDKGYFVLNDVFRYVEETKSLEINPVSVNGIEENAPTVPLIPDEPSHAPDCPVPELATSSVEEDLNYGEEVCDPSDNEEGSVIEEEIVVEPPANSSQDEVLPVADSTSSTVQEDVLKKSYASIVKVMKGNMAPTSVYVPTNTVKAAPVNTEQQSLGSAVPAPAPETSAPNSNSAPESSVTHEEGSVLGLSRRCALGPFDTLDSVSKTSFSFSSLVPKVYCSNVHILLTVEGHSIYIRNLPLNAVVAQLEEEFKRFGPIKRGGIQVRSNKQQGFCFGFVEFESSSSMHSAIEVLTLPFIVSLAIIGSGWGRFPSGRGAFRSDNFRGRGNFGGGRGYGRNDFGNRGEFSGRVRGPTGRSGEGYQRVDQNGSGRVGRQGGMNQTTVSV